MSKKRNLKSWAVMAVLLAGMAPAIAAGGTIYVDADASPGGDGTSWATAYKYLQDALYKPPTGGDQIWVAEGTYKPDANTANPDGTGDREAAFQLLNGVALYGGFPTGGGDWESRNTSAYPTILSGDLDGNDVQVSDPCDLLTEPSRGENSYHVVTGSGTDHNAVLDGFTITAGNADGADSNSEGGGMRNYLGGPTVANCTFSENSAADAAGGMDNDSGDAIVINCTFSRNSAAYDGGGMGTDGGGMDNTESTPTVINCTFAGNSAINDGGGICNYDSSPTVTNCILWGNAALSGAQIYDKGTSSATVSYSAVQGDWPGMGNIDDDPLFIDSNGLDGIVGTADDNLRLSAGSPCIDAGNNTTVLADNGDLDSHPRFVDGDGNRTHIVDMGAYEFAFVYLGDLDGDCDVDFADFAIFANNWLLGK